jgi:hypothetical protein
MIQSANDNASLRVRHDGWTEPRRTAFLESLAATANVKHACATVGMSRQSAYRLQTRDPAFAAAWDETLRMAHERATREFLASLPESLRRIISDPSKACHLQAGRTVADSVPRTLSHPSTPCHLQPTR